MVTEVVGLQSLNNLATYTAREGDGLAYAFGRALQSCQIIFLNHISRQPASSLLPHAILSHSQSARIDDACGDVQGKLTWTHS